MGFNFPDVFVVSTEIAYDFFMLDSERQMVAKLHEMGFTKDPDGKDYAGGDGFMLHARDPRTGELSTKRVRDDYPTITGDLEDVTDTYLNELRVFPRNIITTPELKDGVVKLVQQYRRTRVKMLEVSPGL